MLVQLRPAFFDAKEREFLSHGDIKVTVQKTDTGYDVLRIASPDVQLELLPFNGQQIWNARIAGRDITMKSEVTEPRRTNDYLGNYGAFLVHCGATAMGGPSPDDTHPLHGELPNAPYDFAWLEVGTDDDGKPFVELHGEYKHQVAMTVNYVAHPTIRVTQDDTVVNVSMTVTNKSKAPMDFMYLAHINFAPVIGSKIVGTHGWDTDSIRVRASFPSHVSVSEEVKQTMKELAMHPERTADVVPDRAYDPEAVMTVKYFADKNGRAHTLQVHPDGTSDYVSHRPDEAPNTIRCIQLTDRHQCVGIALPSTAGVDGYLAQKAAGNVIVLPGGESRTISYSFGSLDMPATQSMQSHIKEVTQQHTR